MGSENVHVHEETHATPETGTGQLNGHPPAEDWKPPKIHISTNMTATVNVTEAAIIDLPGGPHLYQRARHLCRIAHGRQPPKWLNRPADAPTIIDADPVALRELANQGAVFLKFDRRSERWLPALPPEWVIATLQKRTRWDFPYLEGIICAPTLRPDGVLVAHPGYDQETGLFFDTCGVAFPSLPAHPTKDEAIDALSDLGEVFVDFPFAAEHDRSATLAATISLVARYAVSGCVPLFAVQSTTRGSGKGLLVNAIATIGTGRTAPNWPQVEDQDEERKRLLTLGLDGDACILIDNITQPLGSAPLDSALTSRTYKDRLLGVHKSVEVPMNAVFFASGNNLTYKSDTARRVLPIKLAPLMEKPEERTGFQHMPLLAWVRQERPRLVVAALTAVKAYFTAGCPPQGVTQFGSFEEWSDLVRQALIWAGQADPCEGRKNIEAESDAGYEALATLLQAWQACYETRAYTLKHAVQDIATRAVETPSAVTPANEWNELSDALSAFDSRYDGKRLDVRRVGNGLKGIEGRVIGDRQLIRDGAYQGVARWRVKAV